jgi:hypothetical protein
MAIKCDNCTNSASYTSADPGVNPAHYCTTCLPSWMHARAEAGHFPLLEPITTPVVEKPAKKKTATPTDVVAETTPSESN